MIVFEDIGQRERVAAKLGRLRGILTAAALSPGNIDRHALLIDALIESGELAQGVADLHQNTESAGLQDGAEPEATMTLARWIAVQCMRSWDSNFTRAPSPLQCRRALDACRIKLRDEWIVVRQPEGYAFYTLYPEAYLLAARKARRTIDGPWHVLGLRSIGTSLGAVVAAVMGDPFPRTLRPHGHPFERRIRWQGAAPDPAQYYAVVDEGPGLSGSSIASVMAHLRASQVSASRIHVFPGHANGPGHMANEKIRASWREVQAHVVDFDTAVLDAVEPSHRLATWVEGVVGPLETEMVEITGGVWRGAHTSHGARDEAELSPAHPWQERRKFLARSSGTDWLVKFSGLGHRARERHACACLLAEAGFSPEVVGRCHGFTVERWRSDMAPLTSAELLSPALRRRLIPRLAAYISFRARRFPAPADSGASLLALCRMGAQNCSELLGEQHADFWDRLFAKAPQLVPRLRRVRTDNRLHAWEWLRDGSLFLKTDAMDHHAGHDLIGCQDAAWDVAGARIEFSLSAAETQRLLGCMDRHVDAHLVEFYLAPYVAFQAAHFHLAAQAALDQAGRVLLERQAQRYVRWLEQLTAGD